MRIAFVKRLARIILESIKEHLEALIDIELSGFCFRIPK